MNRAEFKVAASCYRLSLRRAREDRQRAEFADSPSWALRHCRVPIAKPEGYEKPYDVMRDFGFNRFRYFSQVLNHVRELRRHRGENPYAKDASRVASGAWFAILMARAERDPHTNPLLLEAA